MANEHMKRPLDLPGLEYVFSQRAPLDAGAFLDECKKRGFDWRREQLEELHRLRTLVPFYRVSLPITYITSALKPMPSRYSFEVPAYRPGADRQELAIVQEEGRLHDPGSEPFRPWESYHRVIDDASVNTSVFLYSHYQSLQLASMLPRHAEDWHSEVIDLERYRLRFRLKLSKSVRHSWQEAETVNRRRAVALSALEAVYLPQQLGSFDVPTGTTLEQWLAFQASFDPKAMLDWLGWSVDDLQATGVQLLSTARAIDPLNEWLDLVRQCSPDHWEKLRNEARIAIDYRIAAELLLRFYEDVAAAGYAAPLPMIPSRAPHPLKERLSGQEVTLDRTLMQFGLSPQPSLALVLEGETELWLVPRVMELLGIPCHRSFIDIVPMQGVARNLDAFASHFVAPALGEIHGDFAVL